MTIESATFINGFNTALPAPGDPKSEGDDHIRLLKTVLKSTFPNVAGAVNSNHAELNVLFATGILNSDIVKLHALTATAAELNTMAGIATNVAELNTLHATGILAVDIVKLHAITAAAADLVAPSTGVPTLGTNWATAPGVGFAYLRKGVDGVVSMDFDLIVTTGAGGNSASIVTLPVGYRPVADVLVPASGTQSGGTSAAGVVVLKITAATGVISRFDGSVIPGPSTGDRMFCMAQFPTR